MIYREILSRTANRAKTSGQNLILNGRLNLYPRAPMKHSPCWRHLSGLDPAKYALPLRLMNYPIAAE